MPERSAQVGVRRLVGCIDGIDNGVLLGWVVDSEAPDRPVSIAAWCGTRVLASGAANVLRADVGSAHDTSGYHGFELVIQDLPPSTSDSIVLRELGSNALVDAQPMQLDPDARHVSVARASIEDGHIRLHLRNDGEPASVPISVFDGDTRMCSFHRAVGSGSTECDLPLPTSVHDGRPRLFAIAMGQQGVSAYVAGIVPAVLTPWEHLRGSFASSAVLGLSPFEGYRYFSLREQLKKTAGIDIHNLMAAHEVVCEQRFERDSFKPLELPTCAEPTVSVIIPAFNKFGLTYHTVASLILAYNDTTYEVIIADDASTDETAACEQYLINVRHVRMPSNSGFGGNCCRAAEHARGKYIVFLNNDVEVTSGWLDELVRPFSRFEAVGLTGSKLLNADGTLQEAGGIVWDSGTPWNLGRGQNPRLPGYSYARQTDYLSGAALCIPKDVWQSVGGFSAEFQPAYYEDTDLAFKVREAGLTTWYSPGSEVIHFEGQSNGKDVGSPTGLKRFQSINAAKFKKKWVRSFRRNGSEGRDQHLEKDRGIVGRVLVLDHATPMMDNDAGGYAAVQEMRVLQRLGLKVTFVPENLAYMGDYTRNLQNEGIEVEYAPFIRSLGAFLESRGSEFDLVYVTRHDVAQRNLSTIRRCCSRAKVVLNLADLHFLRELRAMGEGIGSVEAVLAVRDAELMAVRQVDAVVTYSETERAVILSHTLRDNNVFRCPWIAEPKPTPAAFENRSGMLFLGGFAHPPNVQAVQWFVKEVLPYIDVPSEQRKLRIVGSKVPDSVRELESEQVEVLGFMPDLTPAFAASRVFVAPLRYGAGIKGKVVEAMARGLPIVGTNVAVEATGLVHRSSALVADDAKSFASAVGSLLRDKHEWLSLRERALALLTTNYSLEQGKSLLGAPLDYLGVVHT